MEHFGEEDERIEEEIKKFGEHIENKYGATTKDIMKRLDGLNHELGQVNETVEFIEENIVTKEAFGLEAGNLKDKIGALDKRIDDWRDSTRTYFTVIGTIIAIVGIIAPILIVLLTGRVN